MFNNLICDFRKFKVNEDPFILEISGFTRIPKINNFEY